jgi:hypothetical protein
MLKCIQVTLSDAQRQELTTVRDQQAPTCANVRRLS